MKFIKNFILRHKLETFVVILFLSIFLRFYKVPELFVFSGDEEHQLSIAQTIVENFHLEWVGVSSADTGFYLGPFWEYFSALWLFISRGDPLITAYVASSIGVLTTILVYFAGRQVFNRKVAEIATLLYASLPLIVYFDRKFWNPALTSFTSLALFLSLYKTKDSPRWWILVAFIYGMVFHIHLSLVPLGLIILYWYWKKGYKLRLKILLVSLATFLLTISPLIGFEYFHNFSNLKTPARVVAMVSSSPSRINPVGHFKQLFKSLGRIWYLLPYRSNSDEVLHSCSLDFNNAKLHVKEITTTTSNNKWLLSVLSFGLLFWFFQEALIWKKDSARLLGLFIGVIGVSYILLPNTPLEYYLLGIFPLFLYIPGIFYQSIKGSSKKIFITFLLVISIFGIFTVLTVRDGYGLSVKRELIGKVMDVVGDGKYELAADGLCHKYEGWRFLFNTYAKKPERSFTDDSLGWLYPEKITDSKADFKVLVNEIRVGKEITKGYKRVIRAGGFEAYIYASE